MTADRPIDAGEFGAWRRAMAAALRGDGGTDVPCGTCVGCCSSHWPVALRDADAAVWSALPPEYRLDPPGAPPGVRYMGYRADGTCPMLCEARCRVYERRPQTCRDFDCRLFTATGVTSAGPDKPLIDARIAAWRFSYATPLERAAHEAMTAAAEFLTRCAGRAGALRLPTTPVAIAGLAFKSYRVLLEPDARSSNPQSLAQRLLEAARAFDRGEVDAPDA